MERLPVKFSPKKRSAGDLLGREGERLAARHLKRAGYKILYRNYRPHLGGEVDLVCRIPGDLVVVFVEVKTRSSLSRGTPAEAVNFRKQQRIILAAQEWISLLSVPDVRAQFDVVEVLCEAGNWTITHIQSAFQVEEAVPSNNRAAIPAANSRGGLPKRVRAGGARFLRHRGRG